MLKSKKVPRIIKILAVAYSIFAFAIFVIPTTLTMAGYGGNWSDTRVIQANNNDMVEVTDIVTSARGKWDSSSAYAYNYRSNTDFGWIRVWGTNNTNPETECTYGQPKNLPIGEAYYLPNLVYERGIKNAMLWIDPGYGKAGMYVDFYWSPDSI